MAVSKIKPLVLLCSVLIAGCVPAENDAHRARQIAQQDIVLPTALHLAGQQWPSLYWWKTYHDPQLDKLIERALHDSPTLNRARYRVDQAKSDIALIQSGTQLKVNAMAEINEAHISENGYLGPFAGNNALLGTTGPWYTEGTIGLGATLNVDLWGENRHRLEAAVGVENAHKLEEKAVSLEISADVAQLYYAIQTNMQITDLLQQLQQTESFALEAHQERAARGLESHADAQTAKALLLTVKQQLSARKQQRLAFRESLRALSGGGQLAKIAPAPLPTAQTKLPTTLNYQLLARRPDLQAANWCVQASMAQTAVAEAAFYPKFNIKAFFGVDALHMDDLFDHGSQQANMVPGLYLPIFSGGELRANLDKTRRQRDIVISQYNQAVLTAVKEVVIEGSALESLEEEKALQQEKVSSVGSSANNATARYQQGLLSQAEAARDQRQWLLAQIKLTEMKGQLVSHDIVLNKVLGGGK